jgi:hypothetical protein
LDRTGRAGCDPDQISSPSAIGQFPWFAILDPDEAVGLLIGYDSLPGSVPADFSAHPQGDVSKVRNRGRMMSGFEVLHRRLPILNAIEEVFHMRKPFVPALAMF